MLKRSHTFTFTVLLKVLGHPAVTTVDHLGRRWSKQSKETNFGASKVDQTPLALIWRCIRSDLLLYSHMQLLSGIFWQQCGRFEAETDSSEKSAASNNIGLGALWVAKQWRGHLISLFSGPVNWRGEEEFAVAAYGTVNRLTAALLGLWST